MLRNKSEWDGVALVNAAMDIRILWNIENFSTTCEPVGLSGASLLQGVSLVDLLT